MDEIEGKLVKHEHFAGSGVQGFLICLGGTKQIHANFANGRKFFEGVAHADRPAKFGFMQTGSGQNMRKLTPSIFRPDDLCRDGYCYTLMNMPAIMDILSCSVR